MAADASASRAKRPNTELAAAAAAGRALSDASPEAVAATVVNDLGPAAEALLPAVRALRLALLERGALAAAVSGSGSAVFGLIARDAEAAAAIQDLPAAAWVTTARAGL